MTSSLSKIDAKIRAWLPPPEDWRPVECRRCHAAEPLPYPPSDGLCSACRDAGRQTAGPTVEERLQAAGAPRKYAAFTRASWERKYGPWEEHRLLRRLVGWPHAHHPDSWLLFIFSRGYGDRKTGLSTAVLGEALARGLRGRWLSQAGWLRDFKASWNGGPEKEQEVFSRAADAGILLFDDFGGVEGGHQREKPWWCRPVTDLLHHRECHQLPTIVTANLGGWRQVGRIHESLVSRMDVPLRIALPSNSSTSVSSTALATKFQR